MLRTSNLKKKKDLSTVSQLLHAQTDRQTRGKETWRKVLAAVFAHFPCKGTKQICRLVNETNLVHNILSIASCLVCRIQSCTPDS